MDSVPYPLSLSALALFKGLLYDEKNLDKLAELTKDITVKQVEKAKEEMMREGLRTKFNGMNLLEIGKLLVEIAEKGLDTSDKAYLKPLKNMLDQGKSPYEITRERSEKGKREAIKWCILNDIVEGKNE